MPKFDPLRFIADHAGMSLADAISEAYRQGKQDAQPEQRWITSGKPMNSGMYLVTLRQKFEGEEAYGVRIMRFINGNWMLPKHFPEWINEEIEQEVLAWREPPEPYVERREG